MSANITSDTNQDTPVACCQKADDGRNESLTCTGDEQEVTEIGKLLASLAGHSIEPPQRTADGYRLRLARREEVTAIVHEFAHRDKACCSFLSFQVDERAEDIVLTVSGPSEASQVLDLCFAVANNSSTAKQSAGGH